MPALPEPGLHHDPVKPAEQLLWEVPCRPLERPIQRHGSGQEPPSHPWIPPRVGTWVGVGVAALVSQCARCPPQCQLLCGGSVAAPEAQDMGLPACGRAVSGACQAVPGRSARAVSRSQGDWRWGRSRWQGCPKGRHPCMKFRDPFLVSLACLSAQAMLEVKPVGYGMSVVSPVSPVTDLLPFLHRLPGDSHCLLTGQSRPGWKYQGRKGLRRAQRGESLGRDAVGLEVFQKAFLPTGTLGSAMAHRVTCLFLGLLPKAPLAAAVLPCSRLPTPFSALRKSGRFMTPTLPSSKHCRTSWRWRRSCMARPGPRRVQRWR